MSDDDFETDGLYVGDRATGCEILLKFLTTFWIVVFVIIFIIIKVLT